MYLTKKEQAVSRRFEETLIRHCAATLAGHKCASLFSYQPEEGESFEDNLIGVSRYLVEKGVRVRLLKRCREGGLVYVFRPRQLEALLAKPDVRAFLASCGYQDFSVNVCLSTLSKNIRCEAEFPHEIGVFLGYPLNDVICFIENKGCGCGCQGCWKAYTNLDQAQRVFALYQKCREVYTRCFLRGFSVSRLTVAA